MATLATSLPRPSPTLQARRMAPQTFVHLALLALSFVYMYPFLWVLASSFKTPGEFFSSGPSLVPQQLQWSNYLYAWSRGHFSTYLLNTLMVTVAVTALVVLLSS